MSSLRAMPLLICLTLFFAACGSKKSNERPKGSDSSGQRPAATVDTVASSSNAPDAQPAHTPAPAPESLYEAWMELITDSEFIAPKGSDYRIADWIGGPSLYLLPVNKTGGGNAQAYTWLEVNVDRRTITDLGISGADPRSVAFDPARMDTLRNWLSRDAAEWECESFAQKPGEQPDLPTAPLPGGAAPDTLILRYAGLEKCNYPYESRDIFHAPRLGEGDAYALLRLFMSTDEANRAPADLPDRNENKVFDDVQLLVRTLPGRAHWLEFGYPGGVTTFYTYKDSQGWSGVAHHSAD